MSVVADLHVHTTVTDGRATPGQVIADAARAGVRYLVITDHSAVVWDGLSEEADRQGVILPFPGVEISTHLDGRRYHIVAYGHGILDRRFQEAIRPPLDWKNRIAAEVRAVLVRDGHALPPLDEIRRQPAPERLLVSRSALARHLAAVAGIAPDAAYERVRAVHADVEARMTSDTPLDLRYLPTLRVLCEAARVGAVTTVAHPLWRVRDVADVDRVVADLAVLKENGLDGLETRSYHHRPWDDHPRLLAARDALELLRSGGSDYHANGKTVLGHGGLDESGYAAFAARVRECSGTAVRD